MNLLACRECARLDWLAQSDFGLPGLILMENAGRAAVDFLVEKLWKGRLDAGRAVILAGRGNNGGDALVMARQLYLRGKRDLTVVLCSGRPSESAALHAGIVKNLGISLLRYAEDAGLVFDELARAAWIVDGISGTGLRGALHAEYLPLVGAVNAAAAQVAAIDLPSGLGDEFLPGYPAVKADHTLELGFAKHCLYLPAARPFAGRIARLDIGFPPRLDSLALPEAELLDASRLEALVPPPPAETYKNLRGVVHAYAGSRGTTGAALLAAEASLRAGAGLVSLHADEEVYPMLASGSHAIMVKPWAPGGEATTSAIPPAAKILVGPGWGRSEDRLPWLECFLRSGLGGVIDADALYLLKLLLGRAGNSRLDGWILTPHPGEFAMLLGLDRQEAAGNPYRAAREFTRRHGGVLVLKGHVTACFEADSIPCLVDGMNPLLATAGSGDVLAGCIAALLARGLKPMAAAAAGVLLHAEAGRAAGRAGGFFTAEDLLSFVSRAAGRLVAS